MDQTLISEDTKGSLWISLQGDRKLRLEPLLILSDGSHIHPTNHAFEQDLVSIRFGELRLELLPTGCDPDGWLRVKAVLNNPGAARCDIEQVRLIGGIQPLEFDRFLSNGKDMVSFSSLHADPTALYGDAVIGMSDAAGTEALVLGFAGLERSFCPVELSRDDRGISLSAGCELESVRLAQGSSFLLPELLIGQNESLEKLMGQYAGLCSGREPGSILEAAPTGWCSWYYYYDELESEDLYRELDVLEASREEVPVEYIQIDDGWNLESRDSERIWGDWYPGGLFPQGMRQVADDIKRKGFKPGLWLAPFSVDKASRLYREHPEYLISEAGQPKEFFGTYGLDLSHPGVKEFLRETFRRVFDDWGFEYIKIDFLLHALIRGERYDDTKTSAQLFREGLQIIRKIAGDRFILACGSPMGPAIGIPDAMRIGYDVSSRWFVPVNQGAWPEGNCNIKASALQHIWRLWMHRSWWINDADCIIVRENGSVAERHNFENFFPEYALEPAYGLSETEAHFWSRLIWFTSGVLMIGDSISELSPERLELLEKTFETAPTGLGWIDWYPDPYLAILKGLDEQGSPLLGFFNMNDETRRVELPEERIYRAFGTVSSRWVDTDTAEKTEVDRVLTLTVRAHECRILKAI